MMPLVLWVVLSGCDKAPEAEAAAAVVAPLGVTTAPIQAARYRPRAEITGSAEPIRSVQLGFDVPGRLRELKVRRGDAVQEGQLLATLDASLAVGQQAQTQAGVAAAEAALALAQDASDRVGKLGDMATAQQQAQVEAQLKGARAQLDQALAGARLAETSLWHHSLRAPISGVVTAGPDNPGALVSPGMPLFTIEDLSALRIKGSASESDEWLAEGLAATVRSGTGTDTTQAVVERVIPSLDPATRRLPVEIRIDAPPPWLRAHAFVRAELSSSSEVEVFSIPKGALVARPDFAVLVMAGPTAQPVRVPVVVVGEESDRTLVSGQLQVGDQVAVDPPQGFGE